MSSFFGTPFSDEGLTKLIVKLTLKVLQTGCLEEDLEDHVVKHFVTKFIPKTPQREFISRDLTTTITNQACFDVI